MGVPGIVIIFVVAAVLVVAVDLITTVDVISVFDCQNCRERGVVVCDIRISTSVMRVSQWDVICM